jgi:hypothetical protein
MVNVFAPIDEKEEVTDFSRESMAVRIPTRAIIPNAMIRMVRMVLSKLERMDREAMRKFSLMRATLRK